MKRIAFSLLSVVMLIAMALPAGSGAVLLGDSPSAMVLAADVSNLTLYPTDDSWVEQNNPDATHGSDTILHTKYRNGTEHTRRSYLKFDLSDLLDTGCIWSGKLWLYRKGGHGDVVVGAYNVSKYYNATATNWTEGGINWTNAPTDFSLVDSIQVGPDDWYVWNVTSAAQNATGDVLSLALRVVDESGDSKHADFYSKEEAGYKPYLELTHYLTANFTANNTNPCVNTPVQFSDLSTGEIDSWSWDFPGGSPSSANTQGPHTVTYDSAGSYTVNLTVSNAYGSDTESKSEYITVIAPCVATAPDFSICVNTTLDDQLFIDNGANCSASCNMTLDYSGVDNSTVGNYSYNVTCGNGVCDDAEATGTVTVGPGSIGDLVWADVDGNGTKDSGEFGIANITISLLDVSDRSTIATTATDANGYYLFPNLEAGAYIVDVDENDDDVPAGYFTTTYNDPMNISLVACEHFLDADFGFGPKPDGIIGDYVWDDANADGVQDPEEIGIPWIRVILKDESGETFLKDTETDSYGNYFFYDNAVGTYRVELDLTDPDLAGYVPTTSTWVIAVIASNFLDADFGLECEAPTAAFSANVTSGCAPLTVKFTDESTGTIDSWSWDFPGGDPASASGQGPHIVTYDSVGSYTVNLTVSNECGSNTKTEVDYITVSAVTYNLTVISDGCCPIDVSGVASGTVSAGGSETFTGIGEGGKVTVSADDSAVCCEFDSWSDTGAKTHNITMDDDKSVTAYCSVPGPFTITATAGANGNIAPSGAVSVDCGADQTFNITADGCYEIGDVVVDGSSAGAVTSYTFTNVTADHNINATFAIKTYTITATAGANGNISPSGAVGVNCGANQTFNITADACYDIKDVVVDDESKGAVANYTFTNVTANHTISATFAIKTYTITATAGEGGNISPSGAVGVDCGANQTFNITADACYDIKDVVVDDESKGAVANYTFTNVTANHTISATFSAITCTLTVDVTPGDGGDIEVNDVAPGSYPHSYTFNESEVVDLNAVAASGYEFDHWSGTDNDAINPTTVTMDSDKSVTAYFSEVVVTYNLTVDVTPGDGGDIEVNDVAPGSYPHSYTFNESEVVDLNAVAASGYEFDHWSGDLSGNATPVNITMDSDKDVTAHFSAVVVTYNLTVNVTPGDGGDIEVNDVAPGSYPHSYTFNESEVVDLNAVAASGYEFDHWSGNLSGSVNPTNITIDSDKGVTAHFSEVVVTYNLTVNVTLGDGGDIEVNDVAPGSYPHSYTFNESEVVDLNAVAAGGYEFVNWSGNLSGNATPVNITMGGDYSIVANFEKQPKICVSPLSLPLTVAPNTIVTATYTITNCGGGTLNWDSSNVTYDPNGNMTWLNQNITNGTLNANESDTVLVTVNTTGLEEGTYRASITITGSTFIILPIILDVTSDIDVMRNLPGNNLMPNETYPGDTFDVWVNFTNPVDEFNAISLTDLAPDGWEVEVNETWCTPNASEVRVAGNKVEITWDGPYNATTAGKYPIVVNFSALYKVTIPETADSGINLFPLDDGSKAWLEYWFGPVGPFTLNVTGDYRMMITVPADVFGETRDVNANLLSDVAVTVKRDLAFVGADESTPDYSITVSKTGEYWVRGTKDRYFPLLAKPVADGGSMLRVRNPARPDYINFTTPELLSAGYSLNFSGDYGLVPRACNMSYAMESINHWLFIPVEEVDEVLIPHPEWQLSVTKAGESVASWQVPS